MSAIPGSDEERESRRIPPAEATEFPWWAIVDGPKASQGRGAVTGPFMSRQSAADHLAAKRHRFSPRAVVWCMSGHESADWRALCVERRNQPTQGNP